MATTKKQIGVVLTDEQVKWLEQHAGKSFADKVRGLLETLGMPPSTIQWGGKREKGQESC